MAVGNTVLSNDARYPAHLRVRMGDGAPAQLTNLGNFDLLALPTLGSSALPAAPAISFYPPTTRPRAGGTPDGAS
jgi:hypothetical protein